MSNVTRVRQEIDVNRLNEYLSKNVVQIRVPITIQQFKFGQSNPTYLLQDSKGEKFVLRKKPPGELISKTAHAVEREYRVLKALEDTLVPTPKVYCLCQDEKVLGTPFYVMEFLNGRIFENPSLPELTSQQRSEIWKTAVETLALLHSIDVKAVGLSSYGRPDGFYERQVRTMSAISYVQSSVLDKETQQKVGEIPHFSQSMDWFSKNLPQDRSTIVHGDYKLDNLVFHPTESKVIGILDWELSTIGHPLSDLSNLCHPWSLPVMPGVGLVGFGITLPDGTPTKEEMIQQYSNIAKWSPNKDWTFGEAFCHLRLSVIAQGIASRVARRQASSENAKKTSAMFKPIGELCWQTIESRDSVKLKSKL